MRPFVNCLNTADYNDIQEGVAIIDRTVKELGPKTGYRFAIPHPHRYWEYGSAVQCLLSIYQEKLGQNGMRVLDVGAGWSPLGPALSYIYNVTVVEIEPSFRERTDRMYCNQVLKDLHKKELTVIDGTVEKLPNEMFEAVFCISVLEHVNPKTEEQAWRNLAERVKPGGLFFMTTDCVPDPSKHYVFDELRAQNFTVDVLEKRVKMLQEMGFTPLGHPDYTYGRPEVHDFTFFRCGMWNSGGTGQSV